MNDALIQAAVARAHEAVAKGPHSTPADGRPRRRRLAIGDPQADLERVLAILAHHGLLGDAGWLRRDVQLVSVGDHFDWGRPHERDAVAASGLALVAWLAAHPADQAVLLLGNHDLGRVGELAGFTDATFAEAQAEADRAYRGGDTDEAAERSFLARWPQVPAAELVARDFGNFREVQRAWVEHLLRVRRFRAAYAAGPGLMVLHAGVTHEDLDVTGLPAERRADAAAVAEAVNGAVDAAVRAWVGGPLAVPGLHRPGDAAGGEGLGIFYHRPSLHPEDAERVRETPRRRFDPRRLPAGLTQVVGHTRDKKTRELLGLSTAEARDGVVRHLVTDGVRVDYAHGAPARSGPDEAVVVFTDGGMRECPPGEFELFDLDARAAARGGG
ncbi:metallophosphoesterase family protein [Pyxidicoccus xibeiensis]|uniref:metallophosphoesterase n=1 Tax=Pyxidicoccus xibeiensis TaxID=2906759 RepID=UPI0020A7FB76|nr:metallophosphoesterase [Pyxidicoccus xibeiensis]MCP3139838.1 metallophosphoesterase [Pyxidicoccus xibeiensis]